MTLRITNDQTGVFIALRPKEVTPRGFPLFQGDVEYRVVLAKGAGNLFTSDLRAELLDLDGVVLRKSHPDGRVQREMEHFRSGDSNFISRPGRKRQYEHGKREETAGESHVGSGTQSVACGFAQAELLIYLGISTF